MPRQATGSVHEHEHKDGTITFSLRVTFKGKRYRVPLGTSADGWTRARADIELENVRALIRMGRWEPPAPQPKAPSADPTFHEFASGRLTARKGELAESTFKDYSWRLTCHLLPYFADVRVSEFTVALVDAYRQHKVTEREEIREAIAAGDPPRDERGQRIKPLSNTSINMTLQSLAETLDVAVEHGLLETNPARGKRRRLKTKRFRRPFLELDEIQSLLAGAEALDRDGTALSDKAVQARELRAAGLTYPQIAKEMGIALSTAHYHCNRRQPVAEPILHRRAIVAVFIGSGIRVSELCALRWQYLDLDRRTLVIPDAKTEAGIREVRLTPWAIDAIRTYAASIGDHRPGDVVFPTSTGNPRDRKGVCELVKNAATRAAEMRAADRLSPFPGGVTPHALRCTYISLLLEAGYPLKYVMDQVGHDDESTTLRIYARVMQRRPRTEHDEVLDRLLAPRT